MKVTYECEHCGMKGNRAGIKSHEESCTKNPDNVTVDNLFVKYRDLYEEYSLDESEDYNQGAMHTLGMVLDDLNVLQKRSK